MGENSAIEWCDHTFNPWEGCQKVGPGCDHCYAETRDQRFTGGAHWGPHAPRRRTSASNWAQPRRWNRKAQAFRVKHGHWPRVFCASLADVFDNAVDPTWRRDLWELIRDTPDLRWILLTKRVGNMPGMLPYGWLDGAFDHVGLMITVVDQAEADRDVPKLLDVPIAGRQWFGASHEPALGRIDWRNIADDGTGSIDALAGLSFCQGRSEPAPIARLSWIISGGESGSEARPMHPDWARADRDQCATSQTAFLFKQWGEWNPFAPNQQRAHPIGTVMLSPPRDDWDGCSWRVGKARAGRLLDGREHLEFPEALR
ncbi:MAG: hypothetical protein DI527_18130 [Chelatococcus sp.]|nr:MAG: hypothetical protein DI527_18130 [Chelatococcus sp.]